MRCRFVRSCAFVDIFSVQIFFSWIMSSCTQCTSLTVSQFVSPGILSLNMLDFMSSADLMHDNSKHFAIRKTSELLEFH